jgi:hypothetical protein
MSGGTTVLIVIVVIVLLAAIAGIALTARRRSLQRKFGPEYDRVVAEQDSRLRAEAELTDRQRRVRKLEIRPLNEQARQRYSARWLAVQERFVDEPQQAVIEAYDLVTSVMTERGYPIEDDDQMQADLSVDHAATVSHFRAAREITTAAAAEDAQTEDLRQAIIHYRALFSDLLGEPESALASQNDNPARDMPLTDREAAGDYAADANPADATAPDASTADASTADAAGTSNYEQQRR